MFSLLIRGIRFVCDTTIAFLTIFLVPIGYLFSYLDPKDMVHGPNNDRTRWEYVKIIIDWDAHKEG